MSAPESPEDVERIVYEAREKAVEDLLCRRVISAGKGAEMLSMPKHDFLLWMSRRGISPFDETLSADQLRVEASRVRHARALG